MSAILAEPTTVSLRSRGEIPECSTVLIYAPFPRRDGTISSPMLSSRLGTFAPPAGD